MQIKKGDRVRLISPMVNTDSKWKPVEDDMPVGLVGDVIDVCTSGPPEWHQIQVKWHNGRRLALLPHVDRCFEILPANTSADVNAD